ncbi:MAG: KamA family radical SAM protein [Bdellovibrionaceae bacterium]|nr:KamA family radical SAM protein [Pseudobdellovibrionaceae bacterium]MDW8190301.1 KamA family radical SAM protein [Pseudobdellovibrionaceae bacterium]
MKFHFPPSNRPPSVSPENWQDWQWQLRNSPSERDDFTPWLTLNESEAPAFSQSLFAVRVTPYYLSLIDPNDPDDPIRRMAIPHTNEGQKGTQALLDPLNERENNPAPRIIHRYSDRALFLVTDWCSVYCRYCTRKHFTGQSKVLPNSDEYRLALQYLRDTPGICEVILSGGDPLTLSDSKLEKILSDLRAIPHIEIIRIGSRMPVVCPMRITPELTQMMRRFKPVYVMTHFNHPKELTLEAQMALELLVDHGIPLFNQMVLLNGVNNHPAIVQALNRRLLYLRVKPYYMFQCDPSMGSDHWRTPINEGEAILRELWGHLSGLAMPQFSLDIPGGGGKVTLVPNFETNREGNRRRYQGWDGIEQEYIDPPPSQMKLPSDYHKYLAEWETIKSARRKATRHLDKNAPQTHRLE